MKLHIGVDRPKRAGAHSAVVTAANVDKHPLPDLLHGNERRVFITRKRGAPTKLPQPAHPPCGRGGRRQTRTANKSRVRALGRVRGGKAPVGIHQGALSRAAKERHAMRSRPGAGQRYLCRSHLLITAMPPSCTKNADKARDPDASDAQRPAMVFGMKLHIGVDSQNWRTAPW